MIELRNAVASLAVALAFGGFAVAAQAMPVAPVTHQDRQRSINYIEDAQSLLTHGNGTMALDRIGRAETVLLNAQQAGDLKAPRALNDVERAHRDLLKHQTKDAQAALRAAGNALEGV